MNEYSNYTKSKVRIVPADKNVTFVPDDTEPVKMVEPRIAINESIKRSKMFLSDANDLLEKIVASVCGKLYEQHSRSMGDIECLMDAVEDINREAGDILSGLSDLADSLGVQK